MRDDADREFGIGLGLSDDDGKSASGHARAGLAASRRATLG